MKTITKKWFFLLALFVIGGIALIPLSQAFNLGLDLRGGTYMTLKVDTSQAEVKGDEDLIAVVAETIRRRIDAFGVAEALVQKGANETVIIQVPGVGTEGARRIKDIVMRQAFLEFAMVEDSPDKIRQFKRSRGGVLHRNYRLLKMKPADDSEEAEGGEEILVRQKPDLTGSMLKTAYVSFGSDAFSGTGVNLEFDRRGTKRFEKVTTESVGKRMAIILDGEVHSAPVIRETIAGGTASITGGFSVEEAKDLATVLQGGSLPLPVTLIQENVVGPSLGSDSIRKGLVSSFVGLLVVFLFMLFYYRSFGIVANLALFVNIFLLLMLLSFFDATLTLPGIAGIILTIGMAVDANVLIFERIKEALRKGHSLKASIQEGFAKAFWGIFDSNVTTLLTGIILFNFGTGPVKGFAVTMSLGIISSFFSALFVSRLIIETFQKHVRMPVKV